MLLRDALLAYAHFALIFLLAGLLLSEVAIYRAAMGRAALKTLQRIDAAYGIVAGLVVVSGISRMVWGIKGASFYIHNPVFWMKMGTFCDRRAPLDPADDPLSAARKRRRGRGCRRRTRLQKDAFVFGRRNGAAVLHSVLRRLDGERHRLTLGVSQSRNAAPGNGIASAALIVLAAYALWFAIGPPLPGLPHAPLRFSDFASGALWSAALFAVSIAIALPVSLGAHAVLSKPWSSPGLYSWLTTALRCVPFFVVLFAVAGAVPQQLGVAARLPLLGAILALLEISIVLAALQSFGGKPLTGAIRALADRLPEIAAAQCLAEVAFFPGLGRAFAFFVGAVSRSASVGILLAVVLVILAVRAIARAWRPNDRTQNAAPARSTPALIAAGAAALVLVAFAVLNAAARASMLWSLIALACDVAILGALVLGAKYLGAIFARTSAVVTDVLSCVPVWPLLLLVLGNVVGFGHGPIVRAIATLSITGVLFAAQSMRLGAASGARFWERIAHDWVGIFLVLATVDFLGIGIQKAIPAATLFVVAFAIATVGRAVPAVQGSSGLK